MPNFPQLDHCPRLWPILRKTSREEKQADGEGCQQQPLHDAERSNEDLLPPLDKGEAEPQQPDAFHPIVRQIINRNFHVSESNRNVVRHVLSKLRNGYQTLRTKPDQDRQLLIEQCIDQHRSNLKEYVEVMSGFTHSTDVKLALRQGDNCIYAKASCDRRIVGLSDWNDDKTG